MDGSGWRITPRALGGLLLVGGVTLIAKFQKGLVSSPKPRCISAPRLGLKTSSDKFSPENCERAYMPAASPLAGLACSTRKVLPPLDHTRTRASSPLGTEDRAFWTSAAFSTG